VKGAGPTKTSRTHWKGYSMQRFALALLSTTVLGAGFVQVASAADMPARGRAPAYQAPIAAPYSNWSGFYLGGSLGGRWNEVDWTTTIAPVAIGGTSPATYDSSSFRGGIYGGVNFQLAPMIVAGIEADIGWAKNESTRTGIPGLSVAADTTTLRQHWDGSVVGRLGMLVTPGTLLYGLGGASWIDVESNTNCPATAGSFCGAARNQTNEATRTGWTVGAGLETMLMGNWLARVEYRFADYGKIDNTFFAGTADAFTVSEDLRTHTAKVGLAYKFGGGPVYAKY
jgi:outer membrane immunogenic protein